MENYTVILLIMSLMIGASGVQISKAACSCIIIVVGMGIGFPAMPAVELNPDCDASFSAPVVV